jgi:hypothetical protein
MSQITVARGELDLTDGAMLDGSAILTSAAGLFVPEMVGYTAVVVGSRVVTDGHMDVTDVVVHDGAMTALGTTLTCATSVPFHSGMTGDAIVVAGAGVAGGDLTTTIASFTNSGHVELTDAATTTVTGADVTITVDATVLSCDTSAPFTMAMVGKVVGVAGADTGGDDLFTTIATYVSATVVTLTAPAVTSVNNATVTLQNVYTLNSSVASVDSSTRVTLADVSAAGFDFTAATVTIFWAGKAYQETSAYPYVTFSAPLSADTISVKIFLPDGQSAVLANDVNGVNTGLSSTHPSRTYFGGPTYALEISGTDDGASLYCDFGSRTV